MEVAVSEQKDVIFRQALYRFCAAALLYPDESRRDTLKEGAKWLLENLDAEWLDADTRDRFSRVFDWAASLNGDLTELQGAWVGLFGVSRTIFCYPYEGATVPAEYTGAVLAHLQKEYAEAGLVLAKDDLPDHVSVQLEYLSFLCGLEAKAVEEGRDAQRKLIARRRHRFLDQHPGRWIPGLAERVTKKDGKIFAEICTAAAGLVVAEKKQFESAANA
jgi:nitrate reductase assembly molybdenum cofactor insertion protein NarJ